MEPSITFEMFESEWLSEILIDSPSSLEKGKRF